MILHLVPQIYNPYDVNVSLIDVYVPELNLRLKAGIDLAARKPYPNKFYHVACRSNGKKAISGFIIKTPRKLKSFTVITMWNLIVNNTDKQLKHTVHYELQDNDFEAISDRHILFGRLVSNNDFESRFLDGCYEAPVKTMPRMDVIFNNGKHLRADFCLIEDKFNSHGMLVERVEYQKIPTIETERLYCFNEEQRIPKLENAFLIESI